MTPFYLFNGKQIQSGFWRISVHVIRRHEVLSLNPLSICIHFKLFPSLVPFKYLQLLPGYELRLQKDCPYLRDHMCVCVCVRQAEGERGGV